MWDWLLFWSDDPLYWAIAACCIAGLVIAAVVTDDGEAP